MNYDISKFKKANLVVLTLEWSIFRMCPEIILHYILQDIEINSHDLRVVAVCSPIMEGVMGHAIAQSRLENFVASIFIILQDLSFWEKSPT